MAVPVNPEVDDLYYDHVTGTMRIWNGKHWADQGLDSVNEAIKRQGDKALGKRK